MTTDEFRSRVEGWLANARHPRYGKPYDQFTYQPMQEVLRYLKANGFKTFIVSGGGADFMRVWSERAYGVPPEQVFGSTSRARYELRPDGPALVKTLDFLFVDDKAGKPVSITSLLAGARLLPLATATATRKCSSTRQSKTLDQASA
jgi:hypothetical protein